MKRYQYLVSAVLVVALLFGTAPVTYAAGETDYTISNPYETVNWDTWDHYLANLHTHSTASDGKKDLPEMVEKYYELGYDILAMADHGVVNKGWNKKPNTVPPFNLFLKANPVSEARYQEITTGVGRNGRKMLDLTYGIELNMAVLAKNHVNGFFADYGQGYWGIENDFETVVAKNAEAGGLTHLNHLGSWTMSKKDLSLSRDPKFVRLFADILIKYPSCVGMEIVNSSDSTTRGDRILWDELLKAVIPQGRNIWAFANDDSHSFEDVNRSFEYFMLPENTLENVRTAMETGTFFACSKYSRPELGDRFVGTGAVPMVNRITVDQVQNTITLEAEKYDVIEWVYDNEVIATGNTIDLNDYEDEIGCYVRAQLKGDGGITYTQAFAIEYEGMPEGVLPEAKEPKTIGERFFKWFEDVFGKTIIYSIYLRIYEKAQ